MSSNEVWPFVPKYEKTCQLSSEIKTSFDRKIGVYLLMYVEETQFIFLRCFLYVHRIFYTAISLMSYVYAFIFFQDLSMVGIFYVPAFYQI